MEPGLNGATARALEAHRIAEQRLGVRLGQASARAEYWKARAMAAERDLRQQTRRLETCLRRLA